MLGRVRIQYARGGAARGGAARGGRRGTARGGAAYDLAALLNVTLGSVLGEGHCSTPPGRTTLTSGRPIPYACYIRITIRDACSKCMPVIPILITV